MSARCGARLQVIAKCIALVIAIVVKSTINCIHACLAKLANAKLKDGTCAVQGYIVAIDASSGALSLCSHLCSPCSRQLFNGVSSCLSQVSSKMDLFGSRGNANYRSHMDCWF